MKLKIYLVQNNITVTEFAERIGYSRSQISNIINGASNPSKRLAKAIEKATNGEVSADELLKGKKDG